VIFDQNDLCSPQNGYVITGRALGQCSSFYVKLLRDKETNTNKQTKRQTPDKHNLLAEGYNKFCIARCGYT